MAGPARRLRPRHEYGIVIECRAIDGQIISLNGSCRRKVGWHGGEMQHIGIEADDKRHGSGPVAVFGLAVRTSRSGAAISEVSKQIVFFSQRYAVVNLYHFGVKVIKIIIR